MAEIEKVYAMQYATNVYQMSQQMGSFLRKYITPAEMKGEKRFFERVKPTSVKKKVSKYGDTPIIPTEFDRRCLHASEYEWADLLDWTEDQGMNPFIDPKSPITEAGAYAFGRAIDDIIIANALDGVAYEGKDGLTSVSFPSAQQIAVTVGGSGGANVGLNLEKLIQTKSLFGKKDIDLSNPGNQLVFGVTQAQLDDLLRTTEVKNRDYNAVQALVNGEVDRFMGFTFVRTERFLKTGDIRKCVAWCKSGVVFAAPKEISMRVSDRPDKSYAWQSYGCMKAGATRIDDDKVVQVFCAE